MGHFYDCMVCGQEKGGGGCACNKPSKPESDDDIVHVEMKDGVYMKYTRGFMRRKKAEAQ